jgi:hypothetical protein
LYNNPETSVVWAIRQRFVSLGSTLKGLGAERPSQLLRRVLACISFLTLPALLYPLFHDIGIYIWESIEYVRPLTNVNWSLTLGASEDLLIFLGFILAIVSLFTSHAKLYRWYAILLVGYCALFSYYFFTYSEIRTTILLASASLSFSAPVLILLTYDRLFKNLRQ